MMIKQLTISLLVGIGLLLAACSPTTLPTEPAIIPPGGAPEAVNEVLQTVSRMEGVPIESVQLVNFEAREWPDGCLGLPEPEEQCIQVITPGYLVVLQVNGEQFEYRTDETGSIIRQAQP
jgi:hypothetical protein